MEETIDKMERLIGLYNDATRESWEEVRNYVEPLMKQFDFIKDKFINELDDLEKVCEDDRVKNMKLSSINLTHHTIMLLKQIYYDVNNFEKIKKLKPAQKPPSQQKLF